MNQKLHTKAVDRFFDAVLTLENRDECYRFFEDVCTVGEIMSMSQRLEVAHMLRSGRTYLDISDATGASTATISRVNRSLQYSNDGYNIVFDRLEKAGK